MEYDARYRPDADSSRAEMERLQREIARAAVFEDAFDFDPAAITTGAAGPAAPLVAGVDQAFLDDRAVSAIVVLRGDSVVERAYSVTPLEFPYVPGLLSFREGGPILDAFAALETAPDVALFDGSGRIHFRQAGLATHMGVALDLPALGVAKKLLCGEPAGDTTGLAAGETVAIEADSDVDCDDGTVIGHAVQTRQFDSGRINPVYVSPGHRVSARTAADVVLRCRGGYKLPEPTRLADRYADDVKSRVRDADETASLGAFARGTENGDGAAAGERDDDRTGSRDDDRTGSRDDDRTGSRDDDRTGSRDDDRGG